MPDLLHLSPAAGCGCKLPMAQMDDLISTVNNLICDQRTDHVVLDSASRDDAGLYEIGDGMLLATSLDFGTPVSSDAATWGRIGAMNALSDIYAMGATPLFALSIVGWPTGRPGSELSALMTGAVRALSEERTSLLGGHTITSDVPLFGLAVTGHARPNMAMVISNARPGQYLIVTKPIGTGVITAAQKSFDAKPEDVREAETVMLGSNRVAAGLAVEAGIRAATDVTGNGLLGHVHSMAKASGCAARVAFEAVPHLNAARTLLNEKGVVPNSAERNYLTLEPAVEWVHVPMAWRMLLCDPQTSGGLLLCADAGPARAFLDACQRVGQLAVIVGRLLHGAPGSISVQRVLAGLDPPDSVDVHAGP